MRSLMLVLLTGCGAPTAGLKTATYRFEGLRGRDASASATVTSSTIEYDVLSREVKLTINGAARRFTAAMNATTTPGCQGNFGSVPQETRALDAPNIQLGEFLIDAPLLRADCPDGSGVLVLQTGPAGASGAPDCSAEVICLTYRKQ